MLRVGIGAAAGLLVTVPAMLLALISTGAGHGDYLWAQVFFPYSMAVALFLDSPITWPLIVLACVQFPVSGGVIGARASSLRKGLATAGIMGGVHSVVAAACLLATSDCFS